MVLFVIVREFHLLSCSLVEDRVGSLCDSVDVDHADLLLGGKIKLAVILNLLLGGEPVVSMSPSGWIYHVY